MSERRSSARRTTAAAREAFVRRAERLWDEFNAWYEEHPEATFDEMEEELGQQRRAVLGELLELSLERKDLGATAEGRMCEKCGRPMVFKGYARKRVHGLEVDAEIPRAYYVCPNCKVGISPLDRRLHLRRDSWSEGVVREAARLGTTQPSFAIASETMTRLTRLGISESTVWRHHGEVAEKIEGELEGQEQEVPCYVSWAEVEAMEWIGAESAIQGHASVSIDGVTILIREEGYREVKMVSVSEAVVEPEEEVPVEGEKAKRREREVRGRQDGLRLVDHSYRAVLGDKEAFVPALKGELARRRVRDVDKITTVNDGSEWIWDLVQGYLPSRRMEVLDWPHAMQNLAKAGNAAFGEGSPAAQAWLAQREIELWQGQRMQVEIALHELPQRRKERGKAIRQVKGYIDQHWPRLRYDQFRAEGRPIGSGTVESGAKNVVGWRMKRGGQSWSRLRAQRMLAALGEVHSNRWDTTVQRLRKAA
jgi:hypothetical protein